jgi:hypothetical protein
MWNTNNHHRRRGWYANAAKTRSNTAVSGGNRQHQTKHQNRPKTPRNGGTDSENRPKTGKANPDEKEGGAAVKGKCTTTLNVYMVTKLLDLDGISKWCGWTYIYFKSFKSIVNS